jgi:hypothetical protein
MKKIFTIVSCLFLSFTSLKSNAQIFSENFDGGTTLPAGWVQYNVDGLAPATNIAGIMGTNAWAVRAGGPSGTGNMVTSTSWYTPAGASNDWLVTPAIAIPAGPAVLKYDIQAQDPQFPDGYRVYVSTTGNTVADFGTTPFYSEAAAPSAFTTRYVDLASFAGSTVYIAFQNASNDMFLLNLDNVTIVSPLLTDMGALSVNLPSFAAVGSNVQISGSMFNYGSAAVTSMTINYQVDAGTPVSQNLTSLNIAGVSGTYNYSFSAPWVAGPVGNHTIKVWASNINGNADLNTANDEVSGSISVASQLVNRVTCIEEFTSNTCVPCAALNSTFDPLLDDNNTNVTGAAFTNVTAIKYQMNWPSPGTDRSYNPDGVTRQNYYGVNAIPDVYIDGASANADQASIDAAKSKSSPMAVVATATRGGNLITVNVTVTPYITVPTGTKLFIGVMEKAFVDDSSGTTTQTDFHHVMRKMIPNGNGISLALADGVPVNQSGSYSFTTVAPPTLPTQNSYTLWTNSNNLEVIAFVQNTATGEIYQSSLATITAGEKELKSGFNARLFPNPVKDNLVLSLNADKNSNASLDIINALGQVVYSERIESVPAGENRYQINVTNIETGIYFARINFGGNVQTVKFTVAK